MLKAITVKHNTVKSFRLKAHFAEGSVCARSVNLSLIHILLEKVNALPQDKRLSAMTMLFGKEFGDDAAKLANNLPELQRQLKLTAGNDALGSMQKERCV